MRRRPDLLKARERLVELLVETRNPALGREAEALAASYRDAGRLEDARRILARTGLAGAEPEPGPALPATTTPPSASGVDLEFDEFDVGQPAAPPGERGSAPVFDDAIEFAAGEPEPPPAVEKLTTPEPITPVDTEFVSYEQLGNLLEDEMSRASDVEPPAPPEVPIVEEENLFTDEQKFFNLAEELEKELADEAIAEESAEISAPQGEVSLEDIFREFKKGVEQQLSAEDYETHYNLGIAYKEMGLLDDALHEFEVALSGKGRKKEIDCLTMIGVCHLEKGEPAAAVEAYQRALRSDYLTPEATAIS